MSKAEKAVVSVIKRIKNDPRVAYLIGPLSQAYDDVTDAYAEIIGKDVAEFRTEFEERLKYEAWPSEAWPRPSTIQDASKDPSIPARPFR